MFDDSLEQVLKFEGGYSNDPDDPGGATNYGITQAEYGTKPVKNITLDEVKNIYYTDYWLCAACDKIATKSEDLAEICFDCAVNCGVVNADKMLQEILKVAIDGIIGTITLENINDTPQEKIDYLARRKVYYDRVVDHNPTLKKFIPSWYDRLNKLSAKMHLSFHT